MPARKWDVDSLLAASYDMKKDDDGTLLVECKAEKDGEPCPYAWEIDLSPDGEMDKGSRNALLQHAKAHNGGFNRMRRVSRG
jgi:hypothetical protein